MLAAIRHESFYTNGTCSDESLGVYAAWTARKGSFADGMPVCNEHGDVKMIFSGEEFPEPATDEALKGRGHELGRAPAAYLPHVYEEDRRFPASLNGRFHGLVLDRRDGHALLFNDRYGMHRIYVHESKEAVYFAAEAKAILAVCPELRRVDPAGLGELITCGCVLENRTVFAGMGVLPPASAWVIGHGVVTERRRYFDPSEWEAQIELDPESYYRELRSVFTRDLPRYFAGTERIGLSLTGGLDTRMILAWRKDAPGSLPCYTFSGTYQRKPGCKRRS